MVSLARPRALTAVTIIAYSIIPLIGLFVFHWDWREILVFYWLGNITAGFAMLRDILRLVKKLEDLSSLEQRANQLAERPAPVQLPAAAGKSIAVAFFIFHFGLFTTVHGVFVFALVNSGAFGLQVTDLEPLNIWGIIGIWLLSAIPYLMVRLITPSPYKTATESISATYRRVATLHLAIIGGAFVIAYFNLPSAAAILLIVINMISDLRAPKRHREETPVVV